MADLVTALNALTPLGLAGGLAYIIYVLAKQKKQVSNLQTNHLHELPEMAADLRAMRELLQSVNDNVIYVRARINGRDVH